MKKEIKEYLSEIGKVGGKKSRRTLTSEQAKEMVYQRELKKLNKLQDERIAELDIATQQSLDKGDTE